MASFFTRNQHVVVDLLDIIGRDINNLAASKLAYYRAVNMVSQAVGRSEILIQTSTGELDTNNADYYTLNVHPNPNETGTEFWTAVAARLLTTGEALIIPLSGGYYLADTWTEDQSVIRNRRYSGITIRSGGQTMTISRSFNASNVMHIRYDNERIRVFLATLMTGYDSCINAASEMIGLVSRPKFILALKGLGSMGEVSLVDRETGKTLSRTAYAERILAKITEDRASIMTLSEGTDLRQLEVKCSMTPSEMQTMIDNVNNATADAFCIPHNVFNGMMTEKSNGSNEFITYAVAPIVEAINDALNATVVGPDDYQAGQRITVWLGNFAHRDLIDSASALDKLRGVGFTLDEIRQAVGYVPLNTEFSRTRALTKNYGQEGDDSA